MLSVEKGRDGHNGRPSTPVFEEQAGPLESWGFESGDDIATGLTALKLLGGGTRYEAYLAVDDRLLSTVVVKVLRPDCTTDRSALRGMASEASALRSLGHPSLPRCFGSTLDGERPHLILEFIEGPRLSTLIRKYKALPLEQLIPLSLELAAAIHYLHGSGMVHLDVKPQNIIMSGPPKLIDLSVARSTSAAAFIDVPIGTDAYMSPEQCVAQPGTIGPAADIWGLGTTLFHAATGERPWRKGDERYPQLLQAAPELPPEVPPKLADLIQACMAFDPGERPTAREVADALEPLLAALPRKQVIGLFRPKLGGNARRWS